MKPSRGFTLIELLVVVTIIVVLLALLVPAMDKAIYQAQLMQCGANMKASASGVMQYAYAYRRYYPDRGLKSLQQGQTYQYSYVSPVALTEKVVLQWDMRPSIREFIQINKQLVDPLCEPVELEIDQLPDENVAASYTMWWGWKYDVPSRTTANAENQTVNTSQAVAGAGMYKVGDRWSWDGVRFNVLMGDYDLWLGGDDANPVQGSHPDLDGKMAAFAFKYQPLFGTGAGVPITGSLWMRTQRSTDRGPIDMNHAYDDGAVLRLTGVGSYWNPGDKQDPRTTRVPNNANNIQGWKRYQVPRQ